MRLLMISGDRSILQGKKGAFWYTLEGLSKYWERIDIIVPHCRSYRLSLIADRSFPNVFFHPSLRGLWYQPWWILQKGSELIEAHHHDVMTVHSYPPFYNDLGAKWLHQSTNIPFVLEVHHVVGWPVAADVRERIGFMLSHFFLPRIARKAAAVRCVSKGTAEMLQSWGAARTEIVPSFYLDRTLLQPDPTIVKQYDVVACARLVANKGMSELFEALAGIPDATALIIGDGPLRSTLEAKARTLGIADRVTFSGWMATNAEVYRAMQSGKIFVMNSKSEGGPRSALEAMALGLPVIATKVGVMPEVIDDGRNGFFTTGEGADLAAVLQKLLHDEPLRIRSGNAARAILDRFERKALITVYADFLKSVAGH